MSRIAAGIALSLLLSLTARAEDAITSQQIWDVIEATDDASQQRDASRIGEYLSTSFEKTVEFTFRKWLARVKIDKPRYLQLLDEGWATTEDYSYERDDIDVHMLPDGVHGESFSTITENVTHNGEKMTSRFREYATYAVENGKPVITGISGFTLVGDTTPEFRELAGTTPPAP